MNSVVTTNYHGWSNAIVLANSRAEVTIVPRIGRIMQFRLLRQDGPFWENRALDGRDPQPEDINWGNFGGDKTWPAPQEEWEAVTQRGWPPPAAFDSMPVEAKVNGDEVILESPVDPHYGIRTRRRIRLIQGEPKMVVHTQFEKVSGETNRVAAWVITQLKSPVRMYAPMPAPCRYTNGYALLSETPPPDLVVANGLVKLSRDPLASHKIGSDSGTLLWIGSNVCVRMDSPRVPEADYPDQQSSVQIFTSADPLPYVELETLGPLQSMAVGDRIERCTTYTLFPRTNPDPDAEAHRILGQ